MIIKKIEIGGFGKLNDFKILFNRNIQVVYGKNEAGKTTLMEFIKMVFYSRRKGSSTSAEDKLVRAKYSPWNGKQMWGAIEFIHEDFDYRAEKKINTLSILKDEVLLRNQSLGESVKLGKKEEIGERIFGLDLYSFERSSYISNLGRAELEKPKASDDLLLSKMFNLSAIGESESSVLKAIFRVEEAIKELEPLRGKNGKISLLSSEIENLNVQIENLKTFKCEQEALLKQLSEIEKLDAEKQNLENKLEDIRAFKKIASLEKLLESIKTRDGYLKELNFFGIVDVKSWISKFELLRQEINLSEGKSQELKSFIFSANKNFVLISDEEISLLNSIIKEKHSLKNKIEKLRFFSNLEDFYKFEKGEFANLFEETAQIAKIIEDCNLEETNLKNLELLKKEKLNKEIQKSNLEDILGKELVKRSKLIIQAILCIIAFAVIKISSCLLINIAAIVAGCCLTATLLWNCFSLNRLKDSIKNLKKEISKLTIDTQSQKLEDLELKILNSTQKIKINNAKILDILKKEQDLSHERLKSLDEKLKEMLKEKKVSDIDQYYENHAKSKNFLQSKHMYNEFLKKINVLKLEFVESISTHKKIQDYLEANDFLESIASKYALINECEKEISAKKDALNLRSIADNDIKNYLNKLKSKHLNLKLCNYEENYEFIEKRLNELKSLNISDSYIKIKSKIRFPQKNLSLLSSELKSKTLRLSYAKQYLKSLKIANELLQETVNEVRKRFNPKLNEETSKIFNKLTKGKYAKIYMNKDYSLILEKDKSCKSYENFSSGTIDQAYLSLRLAISKLISSDKKTPLILDDILVRYDDERMESTLDFLKENSNKFQTIIFTCHDYVATSAKNKGIEVIHM